MARSKPRVKVPKKVASGDIIQVKSLLSHPMESGHRQAEDGGLVPRQIINKFTCKVNGEDAFSMDLEPAVSSNPYISFMLRIDEDSELAFEWHDDNGDIYTKTSKVKVA